MDIIIPGIAAAPAFVTLGPWRVAIASTPAVAARLDGDRDILSVFTPAERDQLAALVTARRRREWASGRIAAKQAVADFHLRRSGVAPDLSTIAIANAVGAARRGRPGAEIRGVPAAVCVSISHSHDYAVAVASAGPAGVDIERVRAFPDPLAAGVFSAHERGGAAARGHGGCFDPDAAQTLAWTLKEAFMKAHGEGVFGHFADIALQGTAPDGALSWVVSDALARRLGFDPQEWIGFGGFFEGYAMTVVGREERLP